MYIIRILLTTIYAMMLFLYIRSIFLLKENSISRHKWLSEIMLTIIIDILYMIPHITIIRMIATIGGAATIALLFFQSTITSTIFASLIFYSVTVISETISISILVQCGISIPQITTSNQLLSIFMIISLLILMAVILIITTVSQKGTRLFPHQIAPSLFPGIMLSILICFHVLYTIARTDFSPWITWYMLLLLYLNIVFVFYAETLHKIELETTQRILAETQHRLQTEYYRDLQKSQDEIRSLRHDIEKYLLAMSMAANNDQSEEILNAARSAMRDVQPLVVTDNDTISAILNYYVLRATEQAIPISLDIVVSNDIAISSVDLNIIIGNTFDNALHACALLPPEERNIVVKMRQKNQILFYNIKNPYRSDSQSAPKSPYHGYGIRNVQFCARRYNGNVTIIKSNQIFDLSVRINIPNASPN